MRTTRRGAWRGLRRPGGTGRYALRRCLWMPASRCGSRLPRTQCRTPGTTRLAPTASWRLRKLPSRNDWRLATIPNYRRRWPTSGPRFRKMKPPAARAATGSWCSIRSKPGTTLLTFGVAYLSEARATLAVATRVFREGSGRGSQDGLAPAFLPPETRPVELVFSARQLSADASCAPPTQQEVAPAPLERVRTIPSPPGTWATGIVESPGYTVGNLRCEEFGRGHYIVGDIAFARIAGSEIACRRLHVAGQAPRVDRRRDRGAIGIATDGRKDVEPQPVAALRAIDQQVCRSVAIHDDQIQAAVVVDIARCSVQRRTRRP